MNTIISRELIYKNGEVVLVEKLPLIYLLLLSNLFGVAIYLDEKDKSDKSLSTLKTQNYNKITLGEKEGLKNKRAVQEDLKEKDISLKRDNMNRHCLKNIKEDTVNKKRQESQEINNVIDFKTIAEKSQSKKDLKLEKLVWNFPKGEI